MYIQVEITLFNVPKAVNHKVNQTCSAHKQFQHTTLTQVINSFQHIRKIRKERYCTGVSLTSDINLSLSYTQHKENNVPNACHHMVTTNTHGRLKLLG